ncbi:MAG: alpha/beta fold hydrolase, partial [Actinomycetota bacterium]|nr:alpha/beta fold hydrolase [Actinomycetota bacterium]
MNINGANPPLLMVHGWGGSHQETWQNTGIEQLINDAGTTVIGVDLLGHGTSEKPHDPNSYADISEPIRKAIGSRSTSVDAIGFSLGAIALLDAALHNPKYFRKLMLVGIGNAILEPHKPDETARIIAGIDGSASADDILARQFGNYAKRLNNDPLALRAALLRPRREPFNEAALKSIEAEIVLAVGDL